MLLKGSGKLILIFIVILALVAGGYGLFIWFIINIMKGAAAFGLLFVAVVAGIASFFNPCSFPILPAYLAEYYTTQGSSKFESKKKILLSGFVAALGVTAFNILLGSLIGILGVGFGRSLGLAGGEPSSFVRWLRGVIGGLLLLLGFSHATGRGIKFGALERFSENLIKSSNKVILVRSFPTVSVIHCLELVAVAPFLQAFQYMHSPLEVFRRHFSLSLCIHSLWHCL